MPIIPRDQLKALIKEYKLKDAKEIQEMLKKLFGGTLQEMLEAELDSELGYTKYGYKNKAADNSRNGYSKKTVKSNHGKVVHLSIQLLVDMLQIMLQLRVLESLK